MDLILYAQQIEQVQLVFKKLLHAMLLLMLLVLYQRLVPVLGQLHQLHVQQLSLLLLHLHVLEQLVQV